jgi:hypothetical protein
LLAAWGGCVFWVRRFLICIFYFFIVGIHMVSFKLTLQLILLYLSLTPVSTFLTHSLLNNINFEVDNWSIELTSLILNLTNNLYSDFEKKMYWLIVNT